MFDLIIGCMRSYRDHAAALKERTFDLAALSERPLVYGRLDQLVFELLTGAR